MMNPKTTKLIMPCPVCRTEMIAATRAGIEIDHCPQCRGVWLDRGELDKIIERSTQNPWSGEARERARPYRHGDDDDDRRGDSRRKGKRSFLSDLFD